MLIADFLVHSPRPNGLSRCRGQYAIDLERQVFGFRSCMDHCWGLFSIASQLMP